jgi:hypothetical protein
MAGAIDGGVIAVPATVKGVVEILLIADRGDVTGMGADLFARLGCNGGASPSMVAMRSCCAVHAWVG